MTETRMRGCTKEFQFYDDAPFVEGQEKIKLDKITAADLPTGKFIYTPDLPDDTPVPIWTVAKLLGISTNALKIRVSKGKFPQPTSRESGIMTWTVSVIAPFVGTPLNKGVK